MTGNDNITVQTRRIKQASKRFLDMAAKLEERAAAVAAVDEHATYLQTVAVFRKLSGILSDLVVDGINDRDARMVRAGELIGESIGMHELVFNHPEMIVPESAVKPN